MRVITNIKIANANHNPDGKRTSPQSLLPTSMMPTSGTETKGKDQVKISLLTFRILSNTIYKFQIYGHATNIYRLQMASS